MSLHRDGTPWVVLPTYNEAENLAGLVAAAREKLPVAATCRNILRGSSSIPWSAGHSVAE